MSLIRRRRRPGGVVFGETHPNDDLLLEGGGIDKILLEGGGTDTLLMEGTQ